MSQERGRQQKDKLEQISNEYSALHNIFKKLIVYEEELSVLNATFVKKWEDISSSEDNGKIQNGIFEYTNALKQSENNKKESLGYIKLHIQRALKAYPVKIKKQKRSLSRNAKNAREAEDKQDEDIDEKIKKYETTHVADMKQLMLHLINAEMFYHAKSLEILSKSYKSASVDLGS
jgi:FAM92 protein